MNNKSKKFNPGWYRVDPYATVHFFHSENKSVCGIEWRESPKAKKGCIYCDTCQRGSGEKR